MSCIFEAEHVPEEGTSLWVCLLPVMTSTSPSQKCELNVPCPGDTSLYDSLDVRFDELDGIYGCLDGDEDH
jgi:hypothetical protein